MNRRDFILATISTSAATALPGFAHAFERPLPYALMHIFGPGACGKASFLMPEIPPMGAAVMRSQFRRLDSSEIGMDEDRMVCESCGRSPSITRSAIKFVGVFGLEPIH